MSKKTFFGCIRSFNQVQCLNIHTRDVHSNIDLTLIISFYYHYFLPIVISVIVMASDWSWISIMYKYNIFPIRNLYICFISTHPLSSRLFSNNYFLWDITCCLFPSSTDVYWKSPISSFFFCNNSSTTTSRVLRELPLRFQ